MILFPIGFRLDGCSFHYAHTWSKSGIWICWRHLVTSIESSYLKFFLEKTYFSSYVRTMFWATILFPVKYILLLYFVPISTGAYSDIRLGNPSPDTPPPLPIGIKKAIKFGKYVKFLPFPPSFYPFHLLFTSFTSFFSNSWMEQWDWPKKSWWGNATIAF